MLKLMAVRVHWYSEVGIGADDANHQTKDLQVQSSQPGTGKPRERFDNSEGGGKETISQYQRTHLLHIWSISGPSGLCTVTVSQM